jgi:cytosine/adenosine deaminase-related metal-dependent hydrolase
VLAAWFGGAVNAQAPQRVALVGATVWASADRPPLEDAVVLIEGAYIAAVGQRLTTTVPRGVPIVDCTGLAITAGFWNSHMHFFERKWAHASQTPSSGLERQLEDMLTRYGFTSVFETGSALANTRALRVASNRGRSTARAFAPRARLWLRRAQLRRTT